MKVGIDISQIVYGTGVSSYTKELVRKILEIDREDRFILWGGSLRHKEIIRQYAFSLKGNFELKISPLSPNMADFMWNRMHKINVERFVGKVDVFHSSDWTQPPTRAFKVTTVHDLAPLKFPKLTHPRIVAVHKRRLYWVVNEVDRIIVPSISTKEDLIKVGGKEERIVVIPEAAGDVFKPQSEEAINAVKTKYGIKEDYIMTVGYGERKNTRRLIEAYGKVKRKNLKLVIVGGVRKESLERGVTYTGYVSDSDLAAFYSGSRGLIYPSIYEGFGLPVLQAFSCDCPVVTSNTSSLPEVAGEAAVLVDPENINLIAEGIEEVLVRPSKWIKKGRVQVKKFSWEKAARETLRVYRSGFPSGEKISA
ncbi:MAG TPA: glycosyltransferase family 1 protein [Patescibacteria group bacterium]